jgi:hypothetical protein
MTEAAPWSPARAPYAIAVSQSWWFFQATAQFAADAERSTGPSQQIYARQIFSHLRGLRRCAEMQEAELERLAIGQAARDQLRRAVEAFDASVPDVKPGRDTLEHFDEYARGTGKLQSEAIRNLGLDAFEAAAMFWGGGYDRSTGRLTEGPFTITVPAAVLAAKALHRAIYAAGRAVDTSAQTGTSEGSPDEGAS